MGTSQKRTADLRNFRKAAIPQKTDSKLPCHSKYVSSSVFSDTINTSFSIEGILLSHHKQV